MTKLTLWYKTSPSETLGTVPSTQKILFDTDDKDIQTYEWPDWMNNIKVTENPNRVGNRIVNIEDAGFDGVSVLLIGFVKTSAPAQDQVNLFTFLKAPQTTDQMPAGIFSIDNPEGPLMSVVSTATKGMSLTRGSSVKWNPTNKSYDFVFRFIYGGDLT
jgi:hypothetical protein